MTTVSRVKLTYADYASREETADQRHEYLDGEVFAMSGGTLEHSALIGALYLIVGNQLAGRRCRAFDSNARVRTSETKTGETLTMRSIGVTIDVNAVYRGLLSDGARMVLET